MNIWVREGYQKNAKLDFLQSSSWSFCIIFQKLCYTGPTFRLSGHIFFCRAKMWLFEGSTVCTFAKNYERWHSCISAKLRWWKLLAKCLETSQFWIINIAAIYNLDSVGVKFWVTVLEKIFRVHTRELMSRNWRKCRFVTFLTLGMLRKKFRTNRRTVFQFIHFEIKIKFKFKFVE